MMSAARVLGEAFAAAGTVVVALTIADEHISLLWAVIVAFVMVIVWLVRVEARTAWNTRDVERLERDFNGAVGRISSEIRDSESRISASMGRRMDRLESLFLHDPNGGRE